LDLGVFAFNVMQLDLFRVRDKVRVKKRVTVRLRVWVLGGF